MWGSCTMASLTFGILTFGLSTSLLRKAILCTVGCSAASLPLARHDNQPAIAKCEGRAALFPTENHRCNGTKTRALAYTPEAQGTLMKISKGAKCNCLNKDKE